MSLLLIQTPAGENALVVNDHLIISGESTDDSHNLVTTVAERLAAALNEGLSVLDVEPPRRQGWGWEDVINQVRAVSEISKHPVFAENVAVTCTITSVRTWPVRTRRGLNKLRCPTWKVCQQKNWRQNTN